MPKQSSVRPSLAVNSSGFQREGGNFASSAGTVVEMRRLVRSAVGGLSIAVGGVFQAQATEPADPVYAIVNARIETSDPDAPLAQAMVIRDGEILYVGRQEGGDWEEASGSAARRYDLGGRLVLPGFIDGHTHPGGAALTAWHVELPESLDPNVQLSWLRDWAAKHADPTLIYAAYYPTEMFEKSPPSKELIDRYISDRPVIWEDFSDHAAVLNSKALELMEIDRSTPDPRPGQAYFVRDANGNPTGWVKEGAYQDYLPKLYSKIPSPPPTRNTPQTLGPMLAFLRDHGVTGLFDAYTDEDTVKAASEMDKAGTLNMRFQASYVIATPNDVEEAIATLRRWQDQYGTGHIGAHTVKLFLDGTNEIGTSSLLQPFSNGAKAVDPALTKDELAGVLVKLNQAGMDMHIHMVGDRAFRTALDAVELARKTAGVAWKERVTFAHCELIDDADFARVVSLGVTLNWTPHWSGGYFQGNEPFLGQERHDREYRFQPVISLGGRVSFGSDTVSKQEWNRSDPFFGMQVAHTRRDIEKGVVSDTIRKPASEMLQLHDLVTGYTRNSAYQLRLDDKAGMLQKGKSADFIVLNSDLFRVPALEVSKVAPTAVIFEGRVVSGHLD